MAAKSIESAQPSAAKRPAEPPQHSNQYNIFILVLTIYSLIIMVVQLLLNPDTPTFKLANVIDNLICVFFLYDFAMNLIQAPVKRDYLIGRLGIFDLLGSIPTFGFFKYSGLLRLFRLSRLFRLRRLMNPENRKLLADEILHNRSQYALFLTLMLVGLVLSSSAIMVLFFESKSPDANITTGGDAMWWAVVTITTVGYGDKYPVTTGGRLVAVEVMFAGVGIIGALASILASILVAPNPSDEPEKDAPAAAAVPTGVEQELASVRTELAALRQLLEKRESG